MRIMLILLLAIVALALPAGARARGFGGVYAFNPRDQPAMPELLANPDIDGVELQFEWQLIEPQQGRFDWSRIDEAIGQAARAGKKVSLGVTPGVFTPSWVYAAGARSFSFRWDKPWGFAACSMVTLPLPWDGVYATQWLAFVAALGQRYSGSPALTMVKVQGVNAQTGELLLPHAMGGVAPRVRLVDCAQGDDVQGWIATGYRPSKVLTAWRDFATAYARAFPHQKLVLDTGPWGMPGIDEMGRPTGVPEGDKTLVPAIIAAGASILGPSYVVANNGLGANWNWPRPPNLPASVPMGYEAAAGVTGDRRCRMNGFQAPCDPQAVLQAAVQRALGARVAYIGLYARDLRNPALAEVVAMAHRALAAP